MIDNPAPPAEPNDAAPKSAEPPASPTPTPLQNAFRLGWTVVELKSRIQIAELKSRGQRLTTDPLESSVRLSSVWRSGFNRLATLVEKAFPHATTTETLYDPPAKDQLPYLYPPEPDYANVGIIGLKGGQPLLPQFRLYDITRRAINCLTMLYVNEEDSLIPDKVRQVQSHLVAAILKAAEHPEAGGGDETQVAGPVPAADKLQRARQVLTERIVTLLEAWDGYIRENYFDGGVIENDDLELIAYEAGHSMSSISWGIADQTLRARVSAENSETRASELIKAWRVVFRPQAIVRLQRQISALSTALDAAYRAGRANEQRQPAADLPVADDPDLPSRAVQAVKQSLDYWQRAVAWLCKDEWAEPAAAGPAPTAEEWSDAMRLALVEQANVWHTLIIGQQSLRAFTVESVTKRIVEDVGVEIQKAARKDLRGSMRQAQRAAAELSNEAMAAVRETGQTAMHGIEQLFSSSKQWLLVAAAVLVVVFLVIALMNDNARTQIIGSLGTVGSAIAGWLGIRNLQQTKDTQQKEVQSKQAEVKTRVDAQSTLADRVADVGQDLLTRAESAARGAAAEVLKAFERGYEQVRIELGLLSQNIAVTYPLLEFFLWRFQKQSEIEFLQNVLWTNKDREEEIRRITAAALGPFSALMTAGSDEPSS